MSREVGPFSCFAGERKRMNHSVVKTNECVSTSCVEPQGSHLSDITLDELNRAPLEKPARVFERIGIFV